MKPTINSYTSVYFYKASCIHTTEGLTNSLREGVEVVSGSIENKDIIFCIDGRYIASYDVKPKEMTKYTDILFKTFEHKDLNTLIKFMSEEGSLYAITEKKLDDTLMKINKAHKDNLSSEELTWGSYIGFCFNNK